MYTNDKNRPRLDIAITGDVEKFVTIEPPNVNLHGIVGDPVQGMVTIIPDKKYPFKIVNVRAKDGKYIHFQLAETKKSETIAYELKVENLKPDAGRYFDAIIVETDNMIRPQFDIRVYGNLLPKKNE